jgi:hypothetical protein
VIVLPGKAAAGVIRTKTPPASFAGGWRYFPIGGRRFG